MSSNFTITRICQICGNEFLAKTTVTMYCSQHCRKQNQMAQERKAKLARSEAEVKVLKEVNTIKQRALILDKDILLVKDVAALIGCSTKAVYNMINDGRIKASNLGVRQIKIKRSDIDKLLENPKFEVVPKPKNIKVVEPLKIDNCYSIPELVSKFEVTRDLLYTMFRRKNVPKIPKGREVFYSKKVVDKLLRGYKIR
ncbi:DNA binding domain-containing protein, excisionase family [Pedobacter hartonius]|uniref:DNA binding domain-containing protein, excisionase family n=2 Tax=Pedobacter hartonius TaxID=425514 RepID=A0A1H4DAQ0_9SPHI|nr:DNA binding domain-containing protein, excisionase family [Pedobacter hartonius]